MGSREEGGRAGGMKGRKGGEGGREGTNEGKDNTRAWREISKGPVIPGSLTMHLAGTLRCAGLQDPRTLLLTPTVWQVPSIPAHIVPYDCPKDTLLALHSTLPGRPCSPS